MVIVHEHGVWPLLVHIAGCGDQYAYRDDVVLQEAAAPAAHADCKQQ